MFIFKFPGILSWIIHWCTIQFINVPCCNVLYQKCSTINGNKENKEQIARVYFVAHCTLKSIARQYTDNSHVKLYKSMIWCLLFISNLLKFGLLWFWIRAKSCCCRFLLLCQFRIKWKLQLTWLARRGTFSGQSYLCQKVRRCNLM